MVMVIFSPCDMVLGLVVVLVVLVISNINSSSFFLPPPSGMGWLVSYLLIIPPLDWAI